MKKKLIFLTSLFFLLFICRSTNAATVTWTGGGTDNLASNPANWSSSIVPQYGDDVVFDNTSTKYCSWDLSVTLASLTKTSGYTGQITKILGITLTIAKNFVPPSAPSGLTATAVSSSQINLSWADNSNNETGFKIERKIDITGVYSQIATVGANVTTYSDTGLTGGTTYYYRVMAYNSFGDSAYSNDAYATTLIPAPTVTTNPATNVTSNSATLNGTVNPNGFSTTAYFQWGTTTSYGSTTSTQPIGSGTSDISVTANITGLSPSATYHYRIVAANAGGTNYGLDASFMTTSGIPDIAASPITKDFGSVTIGSLSSPQTFTITNVGTDDLVIGSIYLTGTNLDQFVTQNDTCSGISIAPTATCTIEVFFIPSFVGTLTADLTIPSNDPDTPTLNIGLSGTGAAEQCL